MRYLFHCLLWGWQKHQLLQQHLPSLWNYRYLDAPEWPPLLATKRQDIQDYERVKEQVKGRLIGWKHMSEIIYLGVKLDDYIVKNQNLKTWFLGLLQQSGGSASASLVWFACFSFDSKVGPKRAPTPTYSLSSKPLIQVGTFTYKTNWIKSNTQRIWLNQEKILTNKQTPFLTQFSKGSK